MIQLTLTFVSIEAARAALLEIPSSSLVGGPAPEREAPKAAKAAATPAAVVTKAAKPEAATEAPSDPKPEPVVTTSSAKPSASVDYPTLQKAVFALAGKSRDAVVAIAATFGAKTFKELPEAKWPEALAAVSGKLAELEVA